MGPKDYSKGRALILDEARGLGLGGRPIPTGRRAKEEGPALAKAQGWKA